MSRDVTERVELVESLSNNFKSRSPSSEGKTEVVRPTVVGGTGVGVERTGLCGQMERRDVLGVGSLMNISWRARWSLGGGKWEVASGRSGAEEEGLTG